MAGFLAIVALFILSITRHVVAAPCVAFDASFNLHAFGFGDKDWFAGTQDNWLSGSAATDITKAGRPPFDGSNTTCYLSQFTNAIYVIGADSARPSSLYIYNAAAKSWSTQTVTAGSFDFSSFNAILDRDTNVFYALSHGELFFLDMKTYSAATSTALPWVNVQRAPYNATYSPVMALAQNHIHFLNVPGNPVGSASIFVIHFSYFQPEPQSYPLIGGGNFPATHGQVASFFQSDSVQQEFAFIPDDGSATYVLNVETNTTQSLAGPVDKDPLATYSAGITSLVQLTNTGKISFLPYSEGNASFNQAAKWTAVKPFANLPPPSPQAKARTSSVTTAQPTATARASLAIRGMTYCTSIMMGLAAVVLLVV